MEDPDLPNKQARVTVKGSGTRWITWSTDTAHLLPRLIAGRETGSLFLSEHRSGPHRRATTAPSDICPETGRGRLGYHRAQILLGHYGDGLRLRQLRHSLATPLGDVDTSANVIMAKPGTKASTACSAPSSPASPPCNRPPRRCPARDAVDKHHITADQAHPPISASTTGPLLPRKPADSRCRGTAPAIAEARSRNDTDNRIRRAALPVAPIRRSYPAGREVHLGRDKAECIDHRELPPTKETMIRTPEGPWHAQVLGPSGTAVGWTSARA